MRGIFTVTGMLWRLVFGRRFWLPAVWPPCWQDKACPFLLGDGRNPGMAGAGWWGKHNMCLPSARLQPLLSVSKEDPPQKRSTKQTKVYFFSEVCYQECIDQKEIGHEIWANRGRNREVKIISSSSSLVLMVSSPWCAPPEWPQKVWELHPERHPQARKLNHRHKQYTKKVSLSKGSLPTCAGAGLNCNKQLPAADSLILILQDAQQNRTCVKPEKAMKVNCSFSKGNWKKS